MDEITAGRAVNPNPEHLLDAASNMACMARLYSAGKIPGKIQTFMLVTPAKRYLRLAYGGSDLRVALCLLWAAIREKRLLAWVDVRRFVRYKILRYSEAADFGEEEC